MSTPIRRRSSVAPQTPDPENYMTFQRPKSTKKRPALSDITNQSKKQKVYSTSNAGAENSSRARKTESSQGKGDKDQAQEGNVLIAHDVYKNLRSSEAEKRPCACFMERIQKDITTSMRAVLIHWLVQVSEEYKFVTETLFLTVNYIDRYLSGNSINREQLQLLGVTCMMIAAKHEETCVPRAEEFCCLDNSYGKKEICQMESAVLKCLNFEMTVPTAKVFLRLFVHAAQMRNQVQSMKFECLANYLAELSLPEYIMLRYAPSLIAASAVFLAIFILSPSRKPWDSTLRQYTLYQPSDLFGCVKALHDLFLNSGLHPRMKEIKKKYSQHEYKFVAEKDCPTSIPQEFFEN